MISDDKITTIFYIVDEFFKEFENVLKDYTLQDSQTKKRNRKFAMSESEVMTIMILFHYGAFQKPETFLSRLCSKTYEERISCNSFLQSFCRTSKESECSDGGFGKDDVLRKMHRHIFYRLHTH